MNTALRTAYEQFRAIGEQAQFAIRSARTLLAWKDAEWNGYVRIRQEEDDMPYDAGDMLDGMNREQQEAFWDHIEQTGVWGVIGEYTLGFENSDDEGTDAEWTVADSVWGCAGYERPCSPFENACVIGIMQATLDALQAARVEEFAQAPTLAFA